MEQPFVPPAPAGGSVDTVHGSVHDGAWAGEARAAAGCAGPLLALSLAREALAGRKDLDRLARRVERDTADSVFRISGLRRPGPHRGPTALGRTAVATSTALPSSRATCRCPGP
ncbi:hypothetical protein [Streptomyces sp. NPDC056399]|uniref:hypothetical protein n=1 Tax=Streptomyces sp. NPDC056399 TaxID=3345807 RepID=UPI0035E231E3